VHVTQKLGTLTVGAAYVSPPLERLRALIDQASRPPVSSVRAALVAHVYYPDLVPEILACFSRFPDGSTLIATAPEDRVSAVTAAFSCNRQVRVVPVENRGRDIAPFLHLLNSGVLDDVDAILKIHTKRSPHLLDGDIRRKLLFAHLAGSRRRIARILSLFEERSTGVVGWHLSWRNEPVYWMSNLPRVHALCERMGTTAPPRPAFFEGSMFWVRPAALRRLRELALDAADFEPEAGQTDGALHHVVERLFTLAAAADGFTVCNRAGGRLYPTARGTASSAARHPIAAS
jgi:rhamnosyltransferase